MATIKKRNDSFIINFRVGGRRFRRSLRTKCERAAAAALARLEDNLRRVELGTLELPDDVDVAAFLLSDGRAKAKPQPMGPRTVAELLDSFLEQLPSYSIEPSTRQSFEIHIRHLKRLIGRSLQLGEVQLSHLQAYVNVRATEKGIRGRSLSPATIKKELVTLNTAWRWAANNGIVDRPLPKAGIRLPQGVEKPPFQTFPEIERKIARGGLTNAEIRDHWDCLFLTTGEIIDLLEHVRRSARQPWLHPMCVFAAHTGARRSEMIRSRIEDIDLDGGVATIREKKRVHGKTTRRSVPLTPFLQQTLAEWFAIHPGGQHTFCNALKVLYSSKQDRTEFEPLTVGEAHDHLKRTLANSRWSVIRGWHIFRHSFCSNCAAEGIDQRVINAWVGHQTEEMVRRYRHLIPNQQQAAIRQVFAKHN